ncbi:MAG: cupin domain-containing protein [Alphaproteobacteria bacterium]|nr:cupin domain-containing protein [Alphaproteobacteria bacterium]
MNEADRLIRLLDLIPHPEGGHYRQTFRDLSGPEGPGTRDRMGGDTRGHSTLIYFLLRAGEVSHWHRIDAAEVWHFYRGAPVELRIGDQIVHLGPAIEDGEVPQAVVPPGAWQAARSLGEYSLVGCSVAPGFDFATFELAPKDFSP